MTRLTVNHSQTLLRLIYREKQKTQYQRTLILKEKGTRGGWQIDLIVCLVIAGKLMTQTAPITAATTT